MVLAGTRTGLPKPNQIKHKQGTLFAIYCRLPKLDVNPAVRKSRIGNDKRPQVRRFTLTLCRFKPANVVGEGSRSAAEAVFFFRLKLNLAEGEGPSGRSELWQRTVSGGPSRQS